VEKLLLMAVCLNGEMPLLQIAFCRLSSYRRTPEDGMDYVGIHPRARQKLLKVQVTDRCNFLDLLTGRFRILQHTTMKEDSP
jgi:hypothetical protein